MSGVIYKAIPKTVYDLASVIRGSPSSFVAAHALDLTEYREATMLVRFHQYYANNSYSIQVTAYSVAPTDEDCFNFASATPVADTGAIAQTQATPYLYIQSFGLPFGAYVTLIVTLTQTGGSPATTGSAVLSVDVVGKS